MKLGVTGSRNLWWNERLASRLYDFISRYCVSELHHGDCKGWDTQAHCIAESLKVKTIIHPPVDDRFRVFCKGDVILPEKPYLDRNKDIVNAVDFLIAAPDGPEKTRSGTWSTVRYAKKVGVKGVVWM